MKANRTKQVSNTYTVELDEGEILQAIAIFIERKTGLQFESRDIQLSEYFVAATAQREIVTDVAVPPAEQPHRCLYELAPGYAMVRCSICGEEKDVS